MHPALAGHVRPGGTRVTDKLYDIAIVGGGVNGCGIARDAAGRGLSVYLCEQNDLASATSSASTKLIHGGLRYLEYYEFRLVREALIERETLYRAAPHIIHPLRFVLPHHKGLRPWWFLRLGLFFYDHLGGRKILPGTRDLTFGDDPVGRPLRDEFVKGFEYSDCWVDDSRLVVLNAVDAAEKGATVETRTQCTSARRNGGEWSVTVEDEAGNRREIRARILINASGPWVSRFIENGLGLNLSDGVRLVKGSHIIVRRLFEHDQPYIFQNPDGRIIFAIPYEQDFTMLGTTDEEFTGDLDDFGISADEVDYICSNVNRYFTVDISSKDVVSDFSGVRPLYDDAASKAQEATRDYVLKVSDGEAPPVLNIFGGKITTYRKLAEHALEKLSPFLPELGPSWTATAKLPGGDFPVGERERLAEALRREHPFLTQSLCQRLVHAYGTRAAEIIAGSDTWDDLGEDFGGGLFEREVTYLMDRELAKSADDVLWRRSKLGLRMNPELSGRLDDWMTARAAG